eukprot:maker-scaffold22_size673200-snap-gene-5.47 protein:Tk12708 transcript:maker-scaffold22_size673200-snap-gene-5.47-mRNA-1 annotation:"choline o-acetyltransferase"
MAQATFDAIFSAQMSSEDPLVIPKLPPVRVEDTLKRYLDVLRAPLAHEEDALTTTRILVEEFLKDEQLVQDVEELIHKRREERSNWSYEWWLDDMYFNCELPLPINSSPGFVFPKQNFHHSNVERLSYMAKLTQGLLVFKQKIEANALQPDYVASKKDGTKQELCMAQYKRIFSCYRRAQTDQDAHLDLDGTQSRERETVAVLILSQIFILPVKVSGTWLGAEEVFQNLWSIYEHARSFPIQDYVNRPTVLTSLNRRKWGKARNTLIRDDVNRGNLHEIEHCLFLICLDEETQNPTDVERSLTSRFRQMLSGNGPFSNGTNRWFDKTMQLVASLDGTVGMCYEHSVAEGVAVVSVVETILTRIKEDMEVYPTPGMARPLTDMSVVHLEWTVNPNLRSFIVEALGDFKELDDSADLEVFTFTGFGKNQIKSFKCSPDAFCQMVLQLTYFKVHFSSHRVHNKLCFSYESGSTRRFAQGRVDNIRSSHFEALEWVRAMLDEGLDSATKLTLFKKAMNKQTRIMTENITGEGLDIPLLGIREACMLLRPDEEMALFTDVNYSQAALFQLSTSQVTTPQLQGAFMGYGAVVPDGYGVSYNLLEDHIIFCVSSFFVAMDTDSRVFIQQLTQSLTEMQSLFE